MVSSDCLWNAVDGCQQVLNERTPGEMNAKNLGDLVHYDDQADAGFETDQNRLGDEIRDEAQSQDRSQDEHRSH
jgi:hypothetical protein